MYVNTACKQFAYHGTHVYRLQPLHCMHKQKQIHCSRHKMSKMTVFCGLDFYQAAK